MKNIKNILFGTVLALFFVFGIVGTSCNKWTQPEPKDYFEPPTEAYVNHFKDYFNSPHKLMFGWFGNWAGHGGSMGNALMGLPDSLDFVSLWLCYGNLNESQQKDLQAFQERGGRAYLCWTGRDIGEGLTQPFMKLEDGSILTKEESGLTDVQWRYKFWGIPTVEFPKPAEGQEPSEDYVKFRDSLDKSIIRYAVAIADTCRKYGIDGYDYDMEARGDLCTKADTARINLFFRTLITEFAKDGNHLNIDIPGGTGWLTYYDDVADDVLRDIQYLIWQTYELGHDGLENFFYTSAGSVRARKPHMFQEVFEKSIITATFERAVDKHLFLNHAKWVPSFGLDFAGIGAYHIEYDYPGNPDYPTVRKGISMMNPVILKSN